jgi:photosystem II stability/assembly factor-like uncharacterized protein
MGCGVLKSDNGGMTWDTFGRKRCNEKTTGSSPVDIAGLAASWSNPNIVFASVAEALYRSKDGGQNWEQLSLPPKAPIRDIAVDTVDPMIVYASLGANGMWRSLDGGNTWQEIGNNVFDDAEVSSLRPMPDKKDYLVVAATNGSVWRSFDAGTTWQSIRNQLPVSDLFLSGYSTALGDGFIGGTLNDGIVVFKPNPLAIFKTSSR